MINSVPLSERSPPYLSDMNELMAAQMIMHLLCFV